nr:RNA-directed DNA polymerase, eukaryota [Tanacetum cinerariifolium]
MGDFKEVRFAKERFGTIFNARGVTVFNSFITSGELVEVPTGGYSFTWSHKSAAKMSKLDRFLGFDSFVADTWRSNNILESNAMLKLIKKLKLLKGCIRTWVHEKKERSQNLKKCLKNKLFDIDISLDKEEATSAMDRFDRPCKSRLTLDMEFPNKLSTDQSHYLERPFSMEEVKGAVWECGLNKSPGPDGFTFEFYRGNSSFIALISKIPGAKMVKDFRFISLIGSLYKIIAKLLANRLMTVMSDLVNEVQFAFIANRQILDGHFMLNEIIHWCKSKKKQTMIFKVDFEKAFDSVRWDFLDDVMANFGFGTRWRDWILSCLKSSKGSILVNGSPTLEFQFYKGLKQGDPLSPFLFILVMESLNLSLHNVVSAGLFKGGVRLFFRASGLRINLHKSNLIGIVVDQSMAEAAGSNIGCMALNLLFSYLGIVIGGNMSRVKAWDDVINKVLRWLSKWKMKIISIGGRFTLLKSILGALPIYFMSMFNAPIQVLKKLKSIPSKEKGDLGVSSFYALNRALTFKWIWRFFTQGSSLWSRVIKLIHGEDGKIGKSFKHKLMSNWNNITRGITLLQNKGINLLGYIKKKTANGENTLFWGEVWKSDVPFSLLYPRIFALESCKFITVANKMAHSSLDSSLRCNPRGGDGEFFVASVRNLIDDRTLAEVGAKTRWIKYVPIKICSCVLISLSMAPWVRSNSDHTRTISKSIFVTNFPDSTTSKDLWELCKGYGIVVDVYIPNRLSKAGKRFAFDRFIKVDNVERLVGNLCTLWIGRMHLHANVVRFERSSANVPRTHNSSRPNVDTATNGVSFASVLKGNNGTLNNISMAPAMVLDDDCVVNHNLDFVVMGEVKDFSSINNLYFLLSKEGFLQVKIAYLGGFPEPDFVSRERIIWVDIEGVPLHAWSRPTFTKIGSRWGEVMDMEDCKDDCFARKRICIKTTQEDNILEKFMIIIRGKIFVVRAKELFVRKEVNGVDDSDVEGVSDTIFGDQEDISGKNLAHNKVCDEQEVSSDPFELNDLIKNHGKGKIPSGKDSNIQFPPGFTPNRVQFHSPVPGEHRENASPSQRVSKGISSRIMEDAQHVNVHVSPGVEIKTKKGGFVLEVLDGIIKVGQAMGFNMEGCINDMESIIGKRMLWDCISSLVCRWNGLCMVMGDFNEVRHREDRSGSIFNVQGANEFNCFISNSDLIEIQLEGFALLGLILHHRPILLREVFTDYGPSHFRFYHSWFNLAGFDQMVFEAWNNIVLDDRNVMIRFKKKLRILKKEIRTWISGYKKNHAGRIDDLQSKLRDIDRIVDNGGANDDILLRANLAVKGVMVDGEWVDEPAGELKSPVSIEVVRKAVWVCGDNKSPGPDGFTFEFFRKYWDILGSNFYDAVVWFFDNCAFARGCNASFITLIPKTHDPKFVSDYRPISLIGCLYKVITQVLTNRLSLVIPDFISDVQSSFLPNRQIVDGPFIINELLSWCKYKKQQAMVFKVDFAKAYDSVRWDFLQDILTRFGFGPKWRSWIHGCLQSATASVLLNGSPTSEFQFQCGLKQGDPLAPFLFILVMETLHLSLVRAIDAGIFKGLNIGTSFTISHLFYADDAAFIEEWSNANFSGITKILQCFSLLFGLKINLKKSHLLGVGLPTEVVHDAAENLGCSTMKTPFKYLGVMVGGNCSKVQAWDDTQGHSYLSGFGDTFLVTILYDVVSLRPCTTSRYPRRPSFGSRIGSPLFGKSSELKIADLWIGDTRLCALFPRIYALETDKDCSVAEKLHSVYASLRRAVRGGAEASQLDLLQESIQNVILSNMDDRWTWDLNGEGVFRVKDVRFCLDEFFLSKAAIATRWVKYIPIKVNIFVWKLFLDRLPTRDNMLHRGVLVPNSLFPTCSSAQEDSSHLFFSCCMVTEVIRLICRWWNIDWSPLGSYADWLSWFNSIRICRYWDLDWQDVSSFLDWDGWFANVRLPYKLKLLLEGVFMPPGGIFGSLGIILFLTRPLRDVP